MASGRKREVAADPSFRVDAFELSMPGILGADVRLNVSERRTVLVGRNGAGKSAVLEGIAEAVREALAAPRRQALANVTRFRCDFSTNGRTVAYEYHRRPGTATGDSFRPPITWDERCWLPETEETVWAVRDAEATGPHLATTRLTPGAGLLAVMGDVEAPVRQYLFGIRGVFLNLGAVQAGVPRAERQFRVYNRSPDSKGWLTALERDRIDLVALSLLRWHSEDRERFDEFVAMGKRMGVWRDIRARSLRTQSSEEHYRELALVDIDGTNIGLVADGTLRVAEILRALLRPTASLLLIEEPETSIHPGLLRRLLAEIDAYSTACQVIMTTHSPIVVGAAKPDEVRLVHRVGDRTSISPLRQSQLARVSAYLADDGTLGDFVFGGAADE